MPTCDLGPECPATDSARGGCSTRLKNPVGMVHWAGFSLDCELPYAGLWRHWFAAAANHDDRRPDQWLRSRSGVQEIDVVVPAALGAAGGGAKHDPIVQLELRAALLHLPGQVRSAVVDRAGDRGQSRVVDEHDPAGAHEPVQVHEVEEHAVEAVVTIDEPEVEPAPLLEESREDQQRLLAVELDDVNHAGFCEHLKSGVAKPRLLQGIDRHVPDAAGVRREQRVAGEQRRRP